MEISLLFEIAHIQNITYHTQNLTYDNDIMNEQYSLHKISSKQHMSTAHEIKRQIELSSIRKYTKQKRKEQKITPSLLNVYIVH